MFTRASGKAAFIQRLINERLDAGKAVLVIRRVGGELVVESRGAVAHMKDVTDAKAVGAKPAQPVPWTRGR